MEKMKAIAYYRVSTQQQHASGLGLDAQKEAVTRLFGKEYEIIAEHTEVESGKSSNRPKLAEALAQCKKKKAVLLIAKLDRLSRSVSFISNLTDSKVKFRAADNPYATELLIHITASVAQHERKMISERTREALQAAKARGTVLGKHGATLAARNKEAANLYAIEIQPRIEALKAEGCTTVKALAKALDKHPTQMQRILKRLK